SQRQGNARAVKPDTGLDSKNKQVAVPAYSGHSRRCKGFSQSYCAAWQAPMLFVAPAALPVGGVAVSSDAACSSTNSSADTPTLARAAAVELCSFPTAKIKCSVATGDV